MTFFVYIYSIYFLYIILFLLTVCLIPIIETMIIDINNTEGDFERRNVNLIQGVQKNLSYVPVIVIPMCR